MLRPYENLESRSAAVLARIAQTCAKRDALLMEIYQIVDQNPAVETSCETISDAKDQSLPRLHDQAAQVARSLRTSAHFAERSSKEVKRLDLILSRVSETFKLTTVMIQQRKNFAALGNALLIGDLEAAARALIAVQEAEKVFGLSKIDAAIREQMEMTLHPYLSAATPTSESFLEAAKLKIHTAATEHLSAAVTSANQQSIIHWTSLLGELGFKTESCQSYCKWICDVAIRELNAKVDQELKKMDSSGLSHLMLVTAALDHVVATLEREENYVKTNYGAEGLLKLLHELHSQCTSHCVRVLQDFLDRRKIKQQNSSSSNAASAQKKLSDPRKLDQTLDEISNLVSCCNLYMTFMDQKFVECSPTADPIVQQRKQQYSTFVTRDNALFDMIQELLSIYIPMQNEYFEAAFNEATMLEEQSAMMTAASSASKDNGDSNSTPREGIMEALTSLYSSAGSTTSSSAMTESRRVAEDFSSLSSLPEVQLVDDVFYVLRMALHRAVTTKTSSIVSAVIIGVVDVIRSKLVGEISRHITMKKDAHSIPPTSLKWLTAAYRTVNYTSRLSTELESLAVANFQGPELLRFLEQRSDFTETAQYTRELTENWAHHMATTVAGTLIHRCDKFQQSNHVLESLQQCDSADPWFPAAVAHWASTMNYYRLHLSDEAFDALLRVTCSKFCRQLEELILRKQFNAYGAILLDKEVRVIKAFFLERTDQPLRDRFARLNLMVSLLLADSLRDVQLDENQKKILNLDEVRKVLSLRTEFQRAEILALKL